MNELTFNDCFEIVEHRPLENVVVVTCTNKFKEILNAYYISRGVTFKVMLRDYKVIKTVYYFNLNLSTNYIGYNFLDGDETYYFKMFIVNTYKLIPFFIKW